VNACLIFSEVERLGVLSPSGDKTADGLHKKTIKKKFFRQTKFLKLFLTL